VLSSLPNKLPDEWSAYSRFFHYQSFHLVYLVCTPLCSGMNGYSRPRLDSGLDWKVTKGSVKLDC